MGGSEISTSMSDPHATPRAHRPASLSASASQKVSSSGRSSTGSLTIPPSASISGAYLHWPTAQRVRSRQVSRLVNPSASGPLICNVLDPDVPERDVLEQVPVLLDRIAVVGRDVGVVVHVVGRASARRVASKKGERVYQGPKYRVVESGIASMRSSFWSR